MLAMVSRLNDDTITLILEIGAFWRRDLARFSTISSEWLWPARKQLYQCPDLGSMERVSLFARALTDNPTLGSLVHGFRLCTTDAELWTEEDMISLTILLNLDGLSFLSIGGDLSKQSERFLNAMAHPEAIKRLHIRGSSAIPNRGFLEWDEVLACKLSNVQGLLLSFIDLNIVSPSVPYAMRITELYLYYVEVWDGVLPDLLHCAWRSLRKLVVYTDVRVVVDVSGMLECCKENIECLVWHGKSANSYLHDAVFNQKTYPSLRQLGLSGVQMKTDCLHSIIRSCQSLEDFRLESASHVTPQEWVSALRSGALPRLQRISLRTCASHSREWGGDEILEVMRAAEERNISTHLRQCSTQLK